MDGASTSAMDQGAHQRSEALAPGTSLLGTEFTIERPLGNGGFGITYLAIDNYLERRVVIKECFPEVFCRREGQNVLVRSAQHDEKYRSIIHMFMREARSIAKMRHPNIVGVHRVFEYNGTAYMVLDLIEGRDLLSLIKDEHDKLTPDQVREVLIKSLDAIDLVHQNDLLHRDISPDNILLDKWGSPVLIDFGAAREEASRETRAVSAVLVVKDGYSPQEFYFAGGKQGPSSDLYALGATFYHLISGHPPPNSQTRMAEFAGNNPDPCEPLAGRFPEYEPEFLRAIDKAMRILPKERIQSAREWIEVINPVEQQRVRPLRVNTPENLGQKLTQLITETNEFVLKSEPRKPQKPRSRPSEPVAGPSAVSTPSWVDEFNRETSEIMEEMAQETRVYPESPGLIAAPPKKRKRGIFGLFK